MIRPIHVFGALAIVGFIASFAFQAVTFATFLEICINNASANKCHNHNPHWQLWQARGLTQDGRLSKCTENFSDHWNLLQPNYGFLYRFNKLDLNNTNNQSGDELVKNMSSSVGAYEDTILDVRNSNKLIQNKTLQYNDTNDEINEHKNIENLRQANINKVDNKTRDNISFQIENETIFDKYNHSLNNASVYNQTTWFDTSKRRTLNEDVEYNLTFDNDEKKNLNESFNDFKYNTFENEITPYSIKRELYDAHLYYNSNNPPNDHLSINYTENFNTSKINAGNKGKERFDEGSIILSRKVKRSAKTPDTKYYGQFKVSVFRKDGKVSNSFFCALDVCHHNNVDDFLHNLFQYSHHFEDQDPTFFHDGHVRVSLTNDSSLKTQKQYEETDSSPKNASNKCNSQPPATVVLLFIFRGNSANVICHEEMNKSSKINGSAKNVTGNDTVIGRSGTINYSDNNPYTLTNNTSSISLSDESRDRTGKKTTEENQSNQTFNQKSMKERYLDLDNVDESKFVSTIGGILRDDKSNGSEVVSLLHIVKSVLSRHAYHGRINSSRLYKYGLWEQIKDDDDDVDGNYDDICDTWAYLMAKLAAYCQAFALIGTGSLIYFTYKNTISDEPRTPGQLIGTTVAIGVLGIVVMVSWWSGSSSMHSIQWAFWPEASCFIFVPVAMAVLLLYQYRIGPQPVRVRRPSRYFSASNWAGVTPPRDEPTSRRNNRSSENHLGVNERTPLINSTGNASRDQTSQSTSPSQQHSNTISTPDKTNLSTSTESAHNSSTPNNPTIKNNSSSASSVPVRGDMVLTGSPKGATATAATSAAVGAVAIAMLHAPKNDSPPGLSSTPLIAGAPDATEMEGDFIEEIPPVPVRDIVLVDENGPIRPEDHLVIVDNDSPPSDEGHYSS